MICLSGASVLLVIHSLRLTGAGEATGGHADPDRDVRFEWYFRSALSWHIADS
jgi:hypothetical protein